MKILIKVVKFQICILVFPRTKIFIIITLEILLNQTIFKLLQEPKIANQPFRSRAQQYGMTYLLNCYTE